MRRDIDRRLSLLEVEAIPQSDQNIIVVYCDVADDAAAIEAQAKADNPGRLVFVVQYVP